MRITGIGYSQYKKNNNPNSVSTQKSNNLNRFAKMNTANQDQLTLSQKKSSVSFKGIEMSKFSEDIKQNTDVNLINERKSNIKAPSVTMTNSEANDIKAETYVKMVKSRANNINAGESVKLSNNSSAKKIVASMVELTGKIPEKESEENSNGLIKAYRRATPKIDIKQQIANMTGVERIEAENNVKLSNNSVAGVIIANTVELLNKSRATDITAKTSVSITNANATDVKAGKVDLYNNAKVSNITITGDKETNKSPQVAMHDNDVNINASIKFLKKNPGRVYVPSGMPEYKQQELRDKIINGELEVM